MRWKLKYIFITLLLILLSGPFLFAQTSDTDDLKTKIDERNNQIKQLQSEIDQYNIQVIDTGKQATSLQNTLKGLDLTQKKITASINLTQTKISKTSLTIDELTREIDEAKSHININKEAITSAIRNIESEENTSIIEIILSKKNFSDLWGDIDNNRQVRETIREKSLELALVQKDMETKEASFQNQKKTLINLKDDLNDQKQVVQSNKQEKSAILVQTKNKESEYKKIIADKKAQMEAYEKELFDYESRLNLITNPNQIPGAHFGMLNWPLDTIKVTQLFGITGASARLYTSGSHNGVDFRAPIGTPVKAVLDGVVVGAGNTDIFTGCYSFGRWIMIKHNNGLSTIYAHLSLVKVTVGQEVKTGEVIALSGYSGYVDPPGVAGAHLHLGVYATAGVSIQQFVNSKGCKQAIVPIADTRAYLDPILYLPRI